MFSPTNSIAFRTALFLTITLLIICLEVTVTHTSAFSRHPSLVSSGILFDLVVIPTLLFYGLIARPRRLAFSRLCLIALLMFRLALFVLPKSSFLPDQIWFVLIGLMEGALVVIAGLRIHTIRQIYRQLRPKMTLQMALRGSLAAVFGDRLAGVILGEGLVVYYVLFGWQLRSDISQTDIPLTIHRQSGYIALLIGLLSICLLEGGVMHLLLTRWHPAVAFGITLLSAYGVLFFVADAITTIKRPSYLTTTHLHIRLGVRWEASIPRELIANLLYISEKPAREVGLVNGSFLTAPNSLLTFTEPIRFSGPYGIQKQVVRFSFFVDDRVALMQWVKRTATA